MDFAGMATQELGVSSGSFDAKERVKQAVDIVELVGSHLSLRRQGRNYVGLCPWHDDSRPSLQVNPERQSFKCWVCDIGGNVFTFVMKIEGVEFREALEMLADRAGIVLEKPQRPRLFHPSGPFPVQLSQRSIKRSRRRPAGRSGGSKHKPNGRQANALAGDGLGRKAVPSLPVGIARSRAGEAIFAGARHHRREYRAVSARLFAAGTKLDSAASRRRRGGPKGDGRRATTLEAIGILPAGRGRQLLRSVQGPAPVFDPRRPRPAGGDRRAAVTGVGPD